MMSQALARRRALLLGPLLLVAGGGCAAAPSPSPAAPAAARGADPTELRAAEEAIFLAIQRRDRAALERIVADDFVLETPAAPPQDRAAFLAAVAATGEILSVAGEDVRVRPIGPDAGLVTGVQVARVRLDGEEIVDRGYFVDLFERRGGRWQITYAFNVPLPPPSSPAASNDSGTGIASGQKMGQPVTVLVP